MIGAARPQGLSRGPALIHRLSATQLLVLSFLMMIVVGTLGLLVLPGLYVGEGLSFVDALFTATSAVCVTGLIVVDTATYFTPAGQAWILALIQAGGLGMLTFTTLAISALGRRSPLGVQEASGSEATVLRHLETTRLVRSVVVVTLGVEALGALALWTMWFPEMGASAAVWPALFHSVSAFCNAGFSTFSDSLTGFAGSVPTVAVVSALILVGGIGFIVIEDVRARWLARATRRLSVHTRVVLVTTGFLLLAGWIMFLAFEWNHALAGLSPIDRISNAWFMSVTPRTAGFNTVDYGRATNPSLFLTILLMLIGGSPGSTAGGFKTVTAALLFLLLYSRMRGEKEVFAFDRTIPSETLQRATGLVMGGLFVLGGAVFALLVTEASVAGVRDRVDFVQLVFEAHSAFGTVGLSMGVTSEISGVGRLVLTMLMFLGRVGPPAVVAAMAAALKHRTVRFRYAEEDVVLG